jgi:hypothetical protein
LNNLETIEQIFAAYMILPVIGLAVGVYFAPTIVAGYREHPNGMAIVLLNLLAGWTFIGWLAALIWSATAIQKQPAQPVQPPPLPLGYKVSIITSGTDFPVRYKHFSSTDLYKD